MENNQSSLTALNSSFSRAYHTEYDDPQNPKYIKIVWKYAKWL